MTGAAFLGAFLALPILGSWSWGLRCVGALPLSGRLAASAAIGAVSLAVEMFLFHLAGLSWSVPALALPLLVAGAAGLARWRNLPRATDWPSRDSWPALAVAVAALVLAAYAAATARATSVDLLLFWGPKAVRFAAARGLDVAFLFDPSNRQMHPDYPPLKTLLDAWAVLVAGRMAWGAALLTMPLFLLGATLAFFGLARRALPARRAAELTAAVAALLSFGAAASLSAGNAEPLLLFFECLAMGALAFGRGDRSSDWLCAAGLSGAVWTKVEGTAFAALLVASVVLLERPKGTRWPTLARLAVLPSLLLSVWVIWCARHGVTDAFRGAEYGSFSLGYARRVAEALLEAASYGAAYFPRIAVGLLLATGRSLRRALPFTVTALGFTVLVVYSYLHGDFDPSLWIEWSAPRVLLTPLLCLFFGAAAASRPPRDDLAPAG